MTMTDTSALTREQNERLTLLAQESNQELESAGQSGATRAFNLGCYVGLLPAGILVLVTLILTHGSILTAAVIILLALLAIVGFVNLAAYTAKAKAIDRIYQEKVNPEIQRTILALNISRLGFDILASQVLPQEATLRNYLALPFQETESPEDDRIAEE
jgi:hypothetical protein